MKKILRQTIASLGFTPQARNFYTKTVLDYRNTQTALVEKSEVQNPEQEQSSPKDRLDSLKKASETVTVQDVIDAVNAADLKTPEWYTNPKQTSDAFAHLINKLVEAGLTKLDWVYLPQETITATVMAKTPKKVWLEKSVMTLGAISVMSLEDLQRRFKKVPARITVRELLTCPGWSGVSFQNARKKLKTLGFGYDDGVFLQDNTERYFVELLAKECGLSEKKARTVFDFVRGPKSAGLTNKMN